MTPELLNPGVSASTYGDSNCPLTSDTTGSEFIEPVSGNGSVSHSGAIVADGYSGTASATTTNSVKTGPGDVFQKMTTTVKGSAAASGSGDCSGNIDGSGYGYAVAYFANPGTVTLKVSASGAGSSASVGFSEYDGLDTTDPEFPYTKNYKGYVDVGGKNTSRKVTTRVTPGYYSVYASGSVAANQNPDASNGETASASGTQTASIKYVPFGQAKKKKDKGNAKKWLSLPDQLNCKGKKKATGKAVFKDKKKVKKKVRRVVIKAGNKTIANVTKKKKIKPGKKIKLKKFNWKKLGKFELTTQVTLKNGKRLKSKQKYHDCK